MPENNLLSVSVETEHPNFVNPPKGEVEQFVEAGPFLLSVPRVALSRPVVNAGRSL